MGRVSGMGISSYRGLKKPSKTSLIFFDPWDKEISIPETHNPFGNCIPVRVNQAIFYFNCCHLTNF